MGIKIFAGIVTTLVVTVLIIGFFLVGSPEKERQHRFDRQRVDNLRDISNSIRRYYEQTGHLPSSLDVFLSAQGDFFSLRTTVDPETSKTYDYFITGKSSYQLCTTFSFPSIPREVMGTAQIWKHPAGKKCYDLQADKTKF